MWTYGLLLFLIGIPHSWANSTTTTATSTTMTTMTTAATNMTTTPHSTVTPTTTMSTTPTSTVRPAINRICPHNNYMNDRIRANALMAHNYRRSRLAQGLVVNKRGRTLPPATNMLQLLYNCSLETSAVMSAMNCSATGSSRLPPGVEENHYLVPKGEAKYRRDAIIEGVKKWWSQIRIDGGIGQGVTYTQYNVGKPITWFTRMAWATTQTFGCGVRSCGNNWSVVCHYMPGGNKLNKVIYKKGQPCSQCPKMTFCDSSTKLCVPVSAAT